jgi:hypothetical protein
LLQRADPRRGGHDAVADLTRSSRPNLSRTTPIHLGVGRSPAQAINGTISRSRAGRRARSNATISPSLGSVAHPIRRTDLSCLSRRNEKERDGTPQEHGSLRSVSFGALLAALALPFGIALSEAPHSSVLLVGGMWTGRLKRSPASRSFARSQMIHRQDVA